MRQVVTKLNDIPKYSDSNNHWLFNNKWRLFYNQRHNKWLFRSKKYHKESTLFYGSNLCELTKWKRVRALRPPPPLLGAHTMDIHTRNEGSPVEVPLRRTACRDPDRDRWWMLDGGVVGDHCIADSRLANFKQTFSSLKFCSRDSVLAKVSASSRKWSLVGVRSGSSDLTWGLSGAFSGLTETRASGVSLSLLPSMTIGSSGLWPTVVGRVVVPVLVSGVGAGNVVRSAADANRYVTPDLGTGLRRLNFHCMCPLYWYKRRGGVIHQKMKKLMRRFDWYYSRLSR